MLLRNKHGIEIPKGTLDKTVRRHLSESVPEGSATVSNTIGVADPISKKICLTSSFMRKRGCRAPPSVGCPAAAKLYCLNEASFHEPLSDR